MATSNTPVPLSRDAFVQNLSESGLYSRDEIRAILASLPETSAAPDGASLAGQLTAAGKLTTFQADALAERRFDDLLLGNYDILDKLGAGGMGSVFKARHRRMKRIVAIKVLARNASPDSTFVQRFQREVETVARLSHPNIVMAYDADEAAAGPFLVMEFVNGCDLASQVQNHGPLPIRAAVNCTLQAARGLAYAHAQGLIHRDVKPANLLQDVSGDVKVADLGLARFNVSIGQATAQSSSLTHAGGVVGTVDFMAPEQAEDSTTVDHRADIYSLGCTLYYLLTGAPPYVGQSLMATLLKHRQAPIPSPRLVRPETPPALEALCQRMMAKQPADRPASMGEVVAALEAILQGLDAAPVRRAAPTMQGQTVVFSSLGDLETSDTARTLTGQGLHDTVTSNPVAPPPQPRPAAAGMTILLVEPSRTQAVIVRTYLQELGAANVQTANTGQKAFETLQTTIPNIVICAMHLNDMTGVQFAQQIHADSRFASANIVLISSEANDLEAGLHQGLPNAVLLRKPFDRAGLERALLRATGRPAPDSTVPELKKS